MAEYETQIAVVAGGPAGLSAAVQAAEKGADVILVEKNKVTGGAANLGMGLLGIGTRYQKRQMLDVSVEKAYRMFMEYTHYNVDGRLVMRYFQQSAGTITWLENMGVEFEGAFRYFTKSEPTWHIVKTGKPIGPRAASVMNQKLEERARQLGVRFLMETKAEHVLKKDGSVCGLQCQDKEGHEITISCQAVILAAGGGGADPEFIHDETGFTFGKDMFNFAVPGNTGDGCRMAWEAGADHTKVRVEQAAGFIGLPPAAANIMSQPNLLVNKFGKRIMDEEQMQNTTFLSNAASHQKDRVLFSIIDRSIAEYYMANGVDEISMVHSDPDVSAFEETAQKARGKNGHLRVADSIEELAGMCGIDPEALKKTVEDYNTYCISGDTEFFKKKAFLRPIVKAPYYAAEIRPGGYGTVGGIRINENCEACDSEFMPVPGLYAAGADACNIYDDSYMFLLPGNSMGFAVNTGRIAGMEAADYLKR